MAKAREAEKRLIEKLKRQGYRLRKAGTYQRTTIQAEQKTLNTFRDRATELHYRLQEAYTEAMELWLEKYRR